jgi:hypothetical protein
LRGKSVVVACILIALVCIHHEAAAAGREARQGASAIVLVSATIQQFISSRTLYQVPVIEVTEADVRAGYVELAAATRVEFSSNTAYDVMIEGFGERFTRAQLSVQSSSGHVDTLSGDARFNMRQPLVQEYVQIAISYRIYLAPYTRPGTYPWPLSLSVMPI